MQQAVKRSTDISHMSTRKLNKNMTIKTNSDKDSMLKNDQDNIQARKINTSSRKIYNNESIHVR